MLLYYGSPDVCIFKYIIIIHIMCMCIARASPIYYYVDNFIMVLLYLSIYYYSITFMTRRDRLTTNIMVMTYIYRCTYAVTLVVTIVMVIAL